MSPLTRDAVTNMTMHPTAVECRHPADYMDSDVYVGLNRVKASAKPHRNKDGNDFMDEFVYSGTFGAAVAAASMGRNLI